MATPIRDHPPQPKHSGAGEDVRLPGLETCTSVQFESHDGNPGLRYMSASGEESQTAVTGKNLGDKEFATALKDSRGVGSTGSVSGTPIEKYQKECFVDTCSFLSSCLSDTN